MKIQTKKLMCYIQLFWKHFCIISSYVNSVEKTSVRPFRTQKRYYDLNYFVKTEDIKKKIHKYLQVLTLTCYQYIYIKFGFIYISK